MTLRTKPLGSADGHGQCLRDGSYTDCLESQWTWTWEGSPAATRTSHFPTRDSAHRHHSLRGQELRSRRSFKGRRSMTNWWNGTGLLPNKNTAPTSFRKDTEDRTLKAQRLRMGLPEHAPSGTDGRPEEGLVPPASRVRGPCPLPPPRLFPQSLESSKEPWLPSAST